TGVANSCLDLRDRIRYAREHSGAVLGGCKELDGLHLACLAFRPFDIDDPVTIDHQLPHVLAPFVVDDNAFPERDIPDDLFASKRIAAACTRYKQILDALDGDRILAEADELLYGFDARRDACRGLLFGIEFFELLSAEEF